MPSLYAHDPFLAVHRAIQARWLDLPMVALSVACEGWVLALIALAILSWIEHDMRALLAVFLPLGIALTLDGFLVHFLKDAWSTPRPLEFYGPREVRVVMEPLHQLGFPSGHSSAVALFAAYALLAYGRRAWPLVGFAFLGGISRIYVGAHWVIDVVGGWAVGALLGAAVYVLALKLAPAGHLARRRIVRAARRNVVGSPLGSQQVGTPRATVLDRRSKVP